jgi:hypothetical protein
MAGPATRLRVLALLLVGSFLVHQGRFLIAHGDGASRALDATGHGYLLALEPLIGVLLATLVADLVGRLLLGDHATGPPRNRVAVWLVGSLLAVYTGQELLEGLVSAGHADGLAGVFGHGGWIAVPLAVVVGTTLSLFVRPTSALVVRAARLPLVQAPARPFAWSGAVLVPAGAPARHLAGRGPPAHLSS